MATGEVVDGAGGLQRVVVDAVVGDVLADALLTSAMQMNHGRETLEAARDGALEPLQLIAVDVEP